MRILFALNYKNSCKEIARVYKKNYRINIDYDIATTKVESFRMIKEKKYDAIVINSILNNQKLLVSELNFIIKEYYHDKLILLLEESYMEDDTLQILYNLDLFNAVREEDSTNLKIVELINLGRTGEEAKGYYGANDEVNLLLKTDDELIEKSELLLLLNKLSTLENKELIDYINKIQLAYGDVELKYLFSKLDLELMAKLSEFDVYNEIINIKKSNNSNLEPEYDSFLELLDNEDTSIPGMDDIDLEIDSFEDDNNFYIEDIEIGIEDFITDSKEQVENKIVDIINEELPNEFEEMIEECFFDEIALMLDEDIVESSIIDEIDTDEVQIEIEEDITESNIEPMIIEKVIEVEKVIERVVEVEKVIEVKVPVEKVIEIEKVVEKVIEVERNVFSRVIVGLMGVKSGIGTTYHTISLAKSLAKKYKVAVVEFKSDFKDIAEANEVDISKNMFSLDGVDYYSIDIETLYRNVLDKEYNFIIIDFGVYSEEVIKDFYRTDFKILLCGSKAWEDKYLLKFLTEQQSVSNVRYLFNLTTYKKDIVENMPGLQVYFSTYFESIDSVEDLYKDILKDVNLSQNKPVEAKKKSFINSLLRRN